MRRSPLDGWSREHGARMMEFAGWELPLQYTSIKDEHRSVREAAGLFDISHMAQLDVSGKAALDWLQWILPNNADVPPGAGVYSPICNPQGGVIDDAYAFMLSTERFFLVLNASREEADLAWLREHQWPEAAFRVRDERAAMALQGPLSEPILTAIVPDASSLQRNAIIEREINAAPVLISRTGYTGEDGFELFMSADVALPVWDALFEAGRPRGLVAAGLGARDTLRLEMGYPLYGHDADETTTPYEIGYGWTVKLGKSSDFIGRKALLHQKQCGAPRKLIGLVLDEPGVPREGWQVRSEGRIAGRVTSGTHSPTLNQGICLALVEAGAGSPYTLEARGRQIATHEVKLPFYRKDAGARTLQEVNLH